MAEKKYRVIFIIVSCIVLLLVLFTAAVLIIPRTKASETDILRSSIPWEISFDKDFTVLNMADFLPVFYTPEKDIGKKNGLFALALAPQLMTKVNSGETILKLEVTTIFPDEDHPGIIPDLVYDAFRALYYKRKHDTETFFIYYAIQKSKAPGTDYKIISLLKIEFPDTYGASQPFSVKNPVHYQQIVDGEKFTYENKHPVIYINTWNHLFGETDTNPGLTLVKIGGYKLIAGTREEVEKLYSKK